MCTTPEVVALGALYLAHVRIFEGYTCGLKCAAAPGKGTGRIWDIELTQLGGKQIDEKNLHFQNLYSGSLNEVDGDELQDELISVKMHDEDKAIQIVMQLFF